MSFHHNNNYYGFNLFLLHSFTSLLIFQCPLYNTFNELVRPSYVICIVCSMLKLQVQVYLHISLVLLQ